jgi:hypothetical protein
MRYIKAYENTEPHAGEHGTGDYVLMKLVIANMLNSEEEHDLKEFINNNIGQFITEDKSSRLIKYENKPPNSIKKLFHVVFDKYYIWLGKAISIIAFGKTLDEVKIKASANKYNL